MERVKSTKSNALALSCACALLLGTTSARASLSEMREDEKTYNSANLAVTEGHFEDAITILRPLKAKYPDTAQVRYLMFRAYFGMEKWAEAANELRELISMHPDETAYKRNLASCYIQLKRFSDAISIYNELMTADPEKSEYPFKCGFCHELAGNPGTASSMYNKAIQISAESEWGKKASERLEKLNSPSKDPSADEEDMGATIEPGSDDSTGGDASAESPSTNKGIDSLASPSSIPAATSHHGPTKSPDGQPGVNKARAAQSKTTTASASAQAAPLRLLGSALEDLNAARYDECITKLNHILGAHPRHAQAHYLLGVCYAMKHDYKAATSHYQEVINIDPNSEVAKRAGDGLKSLQSSP